MFKDEIIEVGETSCKKISLLKNNPGGYFLSAMLAGVYVTLGVIFAFTVGYMLEDFSAYKLIIGICFAMALSLVVFAGGELFTGNNFVMSIGAINKKVSWLDSIKLWIFCYLGNLVGSLIIVALFYFGGFLHAAPKAEFFIEQASSKIALAPLEILCRAIMCNILVCAATWCGYRCKSESGKLIMIFWCIVSFVSVSFEHSVANMSLLTIGMIAPGSTITFGDILYNISLATVGNMVGGIIFLAIPYLLIARQKNK